MGYRLMAGIVHAKTLSGPDGTNADRAQPSDWNDDHSITADIDLGAYDLVATEVRTDTINEETAAAGVTVDGVLLKDAGIVAGGTIVSDTDSTDDLGSSGVKWANVYADALQLGDEALTAYDEGEWTGTLGFDTAGDESWTFSAQNCRYTRIGRLVFAVFYIAVSAMSYTTASGTLRLRGLPFAASGNGSAGYGAGNAICGQVDADSWSLVPNVVTSDTECSLSRAGGSGALTSITTADLATGETPAIYGHVIYETSA